MTLILKFFDIPLVGNVEILTNSDHGNPDRVWAGQSKGDFYNDSVSMIEIEDGDTIDLIMEAIGQERFTAEMYLAQFRPQDYLERTAKNAG